jgi:DNA ligase D-like protein (predicted ligase)
MTQTPPDDVTSAVDDLTEFRFAGGGSMPSNIEPMLAATAGEPFESPECIFELMWAGVRAMAYVRDGRVRLRGRNGIDLTPYMPELDCITERIRASEAILDGEIVAISSEGHPAFDGLRPRLHFISRASGSEASAGELPIEFRLPKVSGQISFQAFDILWLDGRPLRDRPLWQRKNRLHDVVRSGVEFAAVDFVDDEGTAFFDAVIERKLEGIVAKQKASVYTPGRRSKSWLEIRALQSGDFVIGGYAFGGARRKGEPFGQLLLGAYRDGRFEYVGAVSGGLSDDEARKLIAQLEPLIEVEPPFARVPEIARLIRWTRPEVACRVRFSEWSREGQLRFPIFSALRPDLGAGQCLLG